MKRSVLYSAMMATAIVGASIGQASAAVLASSYIKFENFQIFGSQDGGVTFTQLSASDFSNLDFTSTADADVNLGSDSESIFGGSDSTSSGIDFPTDAPGATYTPAGNDLCLGDCGGALVGVANDNGFPGLTPAAVAGLGSFAWADQFETGAPISGLTTGNPPVPVAANADVANGAYAYLIGAGAGGSNSDNGLNADFTFALLNSYDFLQVSFDLTSEVLAHIDAGETGLASASSLYALDINQGTSWNPVVGGVVIPVTLGTLTDSLLVSTQNPATETDARPLSTLVFRTTGGFAAGTEYKLTARLEASTEVEAVPVPAPVALLGLGLLGLGLARRRLS